MDPKLSRRSVLQRSAALGVWTVVGGAACSKEPKPLSCSDTTALSAADLQMRTTTLAYLEVSLEPGKMCSGCQQFIAGPPGTCGTCKVLKGPINPKGYCKSFVAKPT